MLVCPRCRSEFVAGVAHCARCDVTLVEDAILEEVAKAGSPREALFEAEKTFIGARNLDGARELERELLGAGILCYVHAKQTEGALMSAGSIQYAVAVATLDVPAVREHLEGSYKQNLAAQGLDALAVEAVDLEADEVTCPACGHTGALDQESACADCGLVLGVDG
jgi:hypothetical protein